MRIATAKKELQCSHTELDEKPGACSPCRDFRSGLAIKRHETWRPFEILSAMVDSNGDFKRNAFKFPFKIVRGTLLS